LEGQKTASFHGSLYYCHLLLLLPLLALKLLP
jgi:hypothetical protein